MARQRERLPVSQSEALVTTGLFPQVNLQEQANWAGEAGEVTSHYESRFQANLATAPVRSARPEAAPSQLTGGPVGDKPLTPMQFQVRDEPVENRTGMPDQLKSGLEQLSGYDLSSVRVHRNSAKPAQLNAHAYAQGQDIHLGPGQERQLPHEGWHVVQQMQGRVKPTMQMKGKVNVNDDVGLEKEADVMGAKALQMKTNSNSANTTAAEAIAQRKLDVVIQSKSSLIQRYVVSGAEEQYPEGSVTASKSEIFEWLNGKKLWSEVQTEWCLIGGSAHVEIVEHLLSSNFDGVVTALVSAMGIVPQTDKETKQDYVDFFVHEVMTTEDLDIAVSNPRVAMKFPANQAEAKRLLCPEYSKPGVDLLMDPSAMENRFQLPNGVWVVAPASLIGKPKGGRAGLLAAIGAKKSKDEQLEGKGRKRAARQELMKSVLEQGLLDQD